MLDVKKALYGLFSSFGTILDIVVGNLRLCALLQVVNTLKMRGQAFIVFSNVTEATEAIKQLQNYPFFGKPMVRGSRMFYSPNRGSAMPKESQMQLRRWMALIQTH